MQRKIIEVSIDIRNTIENPIKTDVVGLAYVPSISILPKTNDLFYVPPKKMKRKRIWSFPISIFKDWKKDDEV